MWVFKSSMYKYYITVEFEVASKGIKKHFIRYDNKCQFDYNNMFNISYTVYTIQFYRFPLLYEKNDVQKFLIKIIHNLI